MHLEQDFLRKSARRKLNFQRIHLRRFEKAHEDFGPARRRRIIIICRGTQAVRRFPRRHAKPNPPGICEGQNLEFEAGAASPVAVYTGIAQVDMDLGFVFSYRSGYGSDLRRVGGRCIPSMRSGKDPCREGRVPFTQTSPRLLL